MFDLIKQEAARLQPEMVAIRRLIHQNPELGFEERETAKLICNRLSGLDLQVNTGIAQTGVLVTLSGTPGERTVALRADMDALPIHEENDVPYKSSGPGIMHACGHDAHVSMLIGAVKILSLLKESLSVNVKFIFQPCEEQPSGGAVPMIEAGVLDNPAVDAIFGLHVNPYIPAGFVGVKEGTVMAAADQFTIEILGRGGHGASPHQTVDPIVIAAHVIQALQSIVSRQTDPLEPVVVSVCAIHGGSSFNVIANRVTLTGTVRTLNSLVQQQMPERLRAIIAGVTKAFGADFTLDYQCGYPVLINDPKVLKVATQAGIDIVGGPRIMPVTVPTMGAEDFACFTSRIPGAYFFLGVKPAAGDVYPLHNPRFDIDETALQTGAAVLAACVLRAQETLYRVR